jgi:hypothetical protein
MMLITAVKQGTIAATFQLAGVALSASGNQARAAVPVLQSTFDVCCGFAIIPKIARATRAKPPRFQARYALRYRSLRLFRGLQPKLLA